MAAVIATFASNNADVEGAYTAEKFLPYLKSLLEFEVSQEDFEDMQEMYDSLNENELKFFSYTEDTDKEEGTRLLAEQEAKELYVTFKDSDGNIYALLRTPRLNTELGTPKDRTVKAIRRMASGEAKYVSGQGWYYLGRLIGKTTSVSKDANPNADYSNVPKIAAALGNVVDSFVRDFFNEESLLYRFVNNREELTEDEIDDLLEEYRGNLSIKGIESLANDLVELKRQIESEFGENCTIISDEIELFG